MPKKYDHTIDYEPQATDTVLNFLGINEPWPLEPSNILLKFKNKIDWMFKPALERGLCSGEIVMMINKNFGYFRRDTPWGKMDEIHEWLKNNFFRSYQILAPKYHEILMQTENPYSEDFKKHEKVVKMEW